MKNFKAISIVSILAVFAMVSACQKSEPFAQNVPLVAVSPPEARVTVANWGPQTTIVGVNPNKQPEGTMGIWIEFSQLQELGPVEILFGGKPSKSTVTDGKVITAEIAVDQISAAGEKEVSVKQISSGKIFLIGVFKIAAR